MKGSVTDGVLWKSCEHAEVGGTGQMFDTQKQEEKRKRRSTKP